MEVPFMHFINSMHFQHFKCEVCAKMICQWMNKKTGSVTNKKESSENYLIPIIAFIVQ